MREKLLIILLVWSVGTKLSLATLNGSAVNDNMFTNQVATDTLILQQAENSVVNDGILKNNQATSSPALDKSTDNSINKTQQNQTRGQEVYIPGGRIKPGTFNYFRDEQSVWAKVPGFGGFLTFFERLSLGYRLLFFLAAFAFFFLLSVVFVALVVVISNRIENRKDKWYTGMRKHVIDVLSPLLFNPDELKTHEHEQAENTLELLTRKKEKQVIIDVLMEARRNLTGNSVSVLSQVYKKLRLYKVSKSSVRSFQRWRKVQGIRELSYLGTQSEMHHSVLHRYLNSRHQSLRLEAVLAYILEKKQDPMGFLDYLDRPLTRWIQLSAYYTMYFNNVSPPLLGKYLQHENPQVVIWCLRLIAIYNQVEEIEAVTSCLTCENEVIRQVAIQTSLALENWEIKNVLKNRYYEEPALVRIEILRFTRHFAGDEDFPFLKKVVNTGEFSEKQEAVRILYELGEEGRSSLFEADRSMGGKLKPFIRHVAEIKNRVAV